MGNVDGVIGPRVRAVENMVARAREKTGRRAGGPACVNCRAPLWMSFFFDGTNNHRSRDFPRSHSNVAALWDAHVEDPRRAVFRYYYEGVGTPFEFEGRFERVPVISRTGSTVHWVDREGYREGESTLRQAFGAGLDVRLEKALFDFQNTIEVQQSLTRIDEINIAAFGFSRGATEARAFLNWVVQHSKVKQQGSRLAYDGMPLNVKFLGLFDTVESVGGAGTNRQPELVKTSLPISVEKCLHIVAAHELRGAFPVTALGTDRYTQVVYPGAHADVGGGYEEDHQGRSAKLARIAALQMLDHARGAGLKLHSLAEMQASALWGKRYNPSFHVPGAAQTSLAAYLRHVRKQTGRMREVFEAHMELYWAWIDAGLAIEDAQIKREALRQGGSSRRPPGSKQYLTMAHLLRHSARTPQGRGAFGFPPSNDAVPVEVEHFFETYVHDSFGHFSLSGGTMQSDLSIADYYELRAIHVPKA